MSTSLLSPSAAESINDFQRLVALAYFGKAEHWSGAAQLIDDIADQLVSSATAPSQGSYLRPIADTLRVKVRFVRSKEREQFCGIVEPVPSGFQAVVHFSGSVGARERFTIAHEIGHTLFYTLGDGEPQRIIPALSLAGPRARHREEGLCNRFARALLLTKATVGRIASEPPALDVLFRWATRLAVNPEVVARRVLHDVEGWSTQTFYRILFRTGDPVNVRVIRGCQVRNNVSGPVIAEALQGDEERSVGKVLRALINGAEIWRYSASVWWVSTRSS